MDQEVLDALTKGAWKLAVNLWIQGRNDSGRCFELCLQSEEKILMKCAFCLEGRLRTLSLYSHGDNGKVDSYLELSRGLSAWSAQLPD